jgi:hypothetical protein
MAPGNDSSGQAGGGGTALRLGFSYTGEDVRLDSWYGVDMPTPPSDPVEHGDEAGFWYELHGDGGTLYRRVMHSPIRAHAEVHAEPGSMVHQARDEVSGSFELVVPRLAGARTVALWNSPLDGYGQPARQIAEFELPMAGGVA